MPIADRRHNLKTASGEDFFIVRSPRPITRKLLQVQFIDGEGRTKYPEKAKRFDEEFGYEVMLPVGYRKWKLADPPGIVRGKEQWEDSFAGWQDTTDIEGGSMLDKEEIEDFAVEGEE